MSNDWISAAEAFGRVFDVSSGHVARRTICSRAHAGLIEAKAARLIWHNRTEDDCIIPKEFWWARGGAALEQNWASGDFETWMDHKYHLLAYGVMFARSGIDAIVDSAKGLEKKATPPTSQTQANPGGRQAAAWWDDLWIEMCRQLYLGDLKPNRQADIASAMMKWAGDHGHQPADSTIRERARKLWKALETDAEN